MLLCIQNVLYAIMFLMTTFLRRNNKRLDMLFFLDLNTTLFLERYENQIISLIVFQFASFNFILKLVYTLYTPYPGKMIIW